MITFVTRRFHSSRFMVARWDGSRFDEAYHARGRSAVAREEGAPSLLGVHGQQRAEASLIGAS